MWVCITYTTYLSNVIKTNAKINNVQQNINILLFSFTVLNKLEPLELSKVSLSTIKRQHSKKSDMTDRTKPLKPKRHEIFQIVCKFVRKRCSKCKFVRKRCSKCPPFAWTHAWRCFLHWSTAVSIMFGQKSDHRPTLLNCKALSLLRTVNE